MTTLIWKELRENLKWALLAMLVLGGAEMSALFPRLSESDSFGNEVVNGVTLCRVSFLTVTTFGCAGLGFVFGLVQILPELRRDQWASLLHRPVSRGIILCGKAAAGLLLYLIATLPPFLLAIYFAATPGYFSSPFVPGLVCPGTVDICMGAVYYFAALAATLQRGGWIILRILPPLAAVHASFFVLNEKLFYVSVEAAVLMALALFTAAWGEINNQDLLRARPWLGKTAFLAVVFYGVCGAGDLVHSFVLTLNAASYSNFERYELSDEGIPLHLTYGKGGVLVSVQDLNGKPVTDPKYQPDRVQSHLDYLNTFSDHVGDTHDHHPWVYQPTYRESRKYLWGNNPYSYPRFEQWFVLVEPNYLVGYWPEKKMPFALLDNNGFEPVSATPASLSPGTEIEYAGQDAYCLHDSIRARYAFLAERRIVDLDLPARGPIYGVGSAWGRTAHGSTNVVGVVLATGLAVYDGKANLVTLLPYDRDMDRWGHLSLGLSGNLDRFYLWYDPSDWQDGKTKKSMSSYVEEMDRQGHVLQTYTLPPLPDMPAPRTWEKFLTQRIQSPASFFGTMIYQKIGALLGSSRLRDALNGQLAEPPIGEVCVYSTVTALLLSVATLVWARRVFFAWSRAWAWAGFVFAFGLPGFITFRLAADWPALVACQKCSKRRPVEAAACPHCAADWPAPSATGIEILDPRPEAVAAATA